MSRYDFDEVGNTSEEDKKKVSKQVYFCVTFGQTIPQPKETFECKNDLTGQQ